ncbi:MAG: hypothetical protein R3F03_02430 [Opitutaceae bacterium]
MSTHATVVAVDGPHFLLNGRWPIVINENAVDQANFAVVLEEDAFFVRLQSIPETL